MSRIDDGFENALSSLIDQAERISDVIIKAERDGEAALEDEDKSLYQALTWPQAHFVHKLKAKDSTGKWAYYYIHVKPSKERKFIEAIGGSGMIDLEDFGEVIASQYGEEPNEETKKFLKDKYNFDV